MLLRQPEVEAARKLERGRVIDISATVLIGSKCDHPEIARLPDVTPALGQRSLIAITDLSASDPY